MNIKSVVKVMNFHALLRVDSSRRQAERYSSMEKELLSMMGIIMNNRNLRLDKKIKMPNESLPKLTIYLGSDYGFCGNINSSVSSMLAKDTDSRKIVIGKKLHKHGDEEMYLTQEDFTLRTEEIKEFFIKAVEGETYSSVELVYNRYFNLSTIKLMSVKIYPLPEISGNDTMEIDDFVVEGDARMLLQDMMVAYLMCEFKIAVQSAYASENIMRQNSTTESIKKLDEREVEELRLLRKNRTAKAVAKTTDSYIKQKALSRNR